MLKLVVREIFSLLDSMGYFASDCCPVISIADLGSGFRTFGCNGSFDREMITVKGVGVNFEAALVEYVWRDYGEVQKGGGSSWV